MNLIYDLSIGLLIIASVLIFQIIITKRRTHQLPPGPAGEPILGNARQIPHGSSWLHYTTLKQEYGDLVHLKVPGQHMIILGSHEAATDLLQRRGSIYSDRPCVTLVGEMMGWVQSLPLIPYSEKWRIQRQLFVRHMSKDVTTDCRSDMETESRLTALKVLSNPARFLAESKLKITRLIVSTTYGFKVETESDGYVLLANEVLDHMVSCLAPGAYLIDAIPILKHLPSWFPGVRSLHRMVKKSSAQAIELMQMPFQRTKDEMDTNSLVRSSFTSRALEDLKDGNVEMSETELQWLSGTMYSAGVDTTSLTMDCFYLFMTLYPDAQRKAQEEIDRVIGMGRLPDFEDQPDLPYVECLIKEVYRFHPIAPIGVPHRLMEDDEYRECFIPKGSIIIANAWAMSRDEKIYPDPENFLPDRYLSTEGIKGAMDPRQYIFGHGRRICPGMHFANASIFMDIVTILATMTISKALDADGKEITPELVFDEGLTSGPLPFKCDIRPRSDNATALLQAASDSL